MMKRLFAFVFLLVQTGLAAAQTPNFSENVAPILYQNCTYCHRSDGIAPFAIQGYQDAYNNRLSIRQYVVNKIMPPWPPDPAYSHFSHERILTDAQIKTIKDWVDGGAPEGDPSKAPAPPVFHKGTQLNQIDLSVTIPKYTVTSSTDDYRCFAIPSNLLQQKYMSALEVIPGNSKVVHHVLVFWDTTGTCANLDQKDPKPGYAGFGGVGSDFAELIGGWVPGAQPIFYPYGMGARIPKNATLVIQVHYAPGSENQSDSTRINFSFSTAPKVREVFMSPVLNHYTTIVNGPLYIPANTKKSFMERYTVPIDVSILAVAPHMHLIGKQMKVYGVKTSGDTLPMVKINNWDFHWQGYYAFPKLLHITKGTKLYAEATYDNTLDNPDQPNNPPKDVRVGESTTDEMMLVFFSYMYYQPGDENIVLDTTMAAGIPTNMNAPSIGFELYPNPSRGPFHAVLKLDKPSLIQADILDIQGRVVRKLVLNSRFDAGIQTIDIRADGLPAGTYFCKLRYPDGELTRKLVIME